jgi:hypothetical protein
MKSLSLKTLTVIILTSLMIMMTNCSAPEKDRIADLPAIVPLPAEMQLSGGQFILTPETKIICPAGNEEIKNIAEYLNQLVTKTTGFQLDIIDSDTPARIAGYWQRRVSAEEQPERSSDQCKWTKWSVLWRGYIMAIIASCQHWKQSLNTGCSDY